MEEGKRKKIEIEAGAKYSEREVGFVRVCS